MLYHLLRGSSHHRSNLLKLGYVSPEVSVCCNESFYFQESGVGGFATHEQKNLKHQRYPFQVFINHHLSAMSFIALDRYHYSILRGAPVGAKVLLQCSSVSLLHLLIHNLQLSPSIPLASYLLASTVSPSCNSPSVTTEGKKNYIII